MENLNVFNNDQILNLPVTQAQYDSVSLNRKSTFINIFDSEGEFVTSVNSLDMKGGADYLFLAEVLRASELAGTSPVNSLASFKGLTFRLAALQTSELASPLKRNLAKREDWKKAPAPAQPAQAQQQQQPIQNQNVF